MPKRIITIILLMLISTQSMGIDIDQNTRRCPSRVCDPGLNLKNFFKKTAKDMSSGIFQGARQEFDTAMNGLFNDHLEPLFNDVSNNLDKVAKNNISRTEESARAILEEGIKGFKDIENQTNTHMESLLRNVDDRSRGIIQKIFAEFNQARAEFILSVRTLIGEVDRDLENRINQLSLLMMDVLLQAKDFPGQIQKDLIVPTIVKLGKLKDDISKDINNLLDRLGCITTVTIEIAFNRLENVLSKENPFAKVEFNCDGNCGGWFRNQCHSCCEKVQLVHNHYNYDIMERYRLAKCWRESPLDRDPLPLPSEILDAYAQLEDNATRLFCYATKSNPISQGMLDTAKDDIQYYRKKRSYWK